MNKMFTVVSVAILGVMSSSAYAVNVVPEIDGANASITLGLTVAAVALVREFRRNR